MSCDKNEFRMFAKYLDSYKYKKNATIQQLIAFHQNVNNDYFFNMYHSPGFVGNLHKLPYVSSEPTPATISAPLSGTETALTPYSAFGNPHILPKMALKLAKPLETPRETVPKKKVTLEVTINGLQDLVDITDKYEYKEDEEYNIDLKLLMNIKEELHELNEMIGMETLKDSIANQLLYFIQELHINHIQKKDSAGSGIEATEKVHEYKHTVLSGPPGTGKTEVAKIIGRMYSKIGILEKNVFKKVTRNDLVAGYLGQTAMKTKAAITEALGGVLFIDEVYSLAAGNNDLDSYSKECIDTLCECLSDNKDNLMVIVAGYEEDNENFFRANQGLQSRFIWRFKIEQYLPKELHQIFIKKVTETDWKLDANAVTSKWFDKNKEVFKYFGRDMELLFTYVKIAHSRRIFGKDLSLKKTITMEDMETGLKMFQANRKKVERPKVLDTMYI